MEKRLITEALRRQNGNRRRATKDFGIDASTPYRKIKSFDIATPPTDGRTHSS